MNANGVTGGGRCHQYERRLELNEEDLPTCPFPRQQRKADAEGLWRVVVTRIESDFRFVPVPRDDISRLAEIEDFILRYEWLGSLPHRPTHYFTARTTATHGDMVVGAVVMVDTRRLADCFAAIDFFEHRRLPYLVAINCFDGVQYHGAQDVRDALAVSPDVPVVSCDARSRESTKQVLISLVEYVLTMRRQRATAPA